MVDDIFKYVKLQSAAMSKIQLTAYAEYKKMRSGELRPVLGTSSLRELQDGTGVFQVASVSMYWRFDADVKKENVLPLLPRKQLEHQEFPRGVIALLYGPKETAAELRYRMSEASAAGHELAIEEFLFEIGEIAVGRIDTEMLADLRFAHEERFAVRTREAIALIFNRYAIEDHGGDATKADRFTLAENERGQAKCNANARMMATRPDYWARAFAESDLLRHLDMLVMRVAQDPEVKRLRSIALVKPRTPYAPVQKYRPDQIRLALPSGFRQRIAED